MTAARASDETPTAPPTVAIIGAGPAGMRAAEQLVAAGLRPVVIDEGARHGGQIYRQPPPALQRDARDLYGFEAGRARAVLGRFEALRAQIDYRPSTLVWQLEQRSLQLLQAGRTGAHPGAHSQALAFDALILATGATDRVLPFPGWTLPGVTTLGAAQVALKSQGCLIGPRVVFAGTGPLLYLVAWQYTAHGGRVAAVLDSAPAASKWRAAPALLARPGVAAKGATYVARLRLHGVPLHAGVTLVGAQGAQRVSALTWTADGRTHSTDCDAIGFGHGLRSETQLADLAGCTFAYSALDEAWLPTMDAAGRSSVARVYLAGDGAGVLGADAAELAGARAALAALEDLGITHPGASRAAVLERALHAHRAFRRGLETAFELPVRWAAQAPDDLIVCRCEEVTAGALRACVRDTGTREMNRLKALTRIGMGRCQGRMCAPAASRLLAHAAGCALPEVGRLRGQAPVKPVPVAMQPPAKPHEIASSATVPEDEDD